MKSRLTAQLILSTSILLGCDASVDLGDLPGETDGGSGSASETGETETSPAEAVTEVDVLFVIDNSGSMGTAQQQLQEGSEALVSALEASGLDYRVGVTSTDNGNYWCRGSGVGTPHNGHLVFPTSCRQRQDDFYFSGTDTDVFEAACSERCAAEQIPMAEGAPPWLSPNTIGNIDMADALACSLPLGINGCGFEQPLESMFRSVALSDSAGTAESGFIRPDAHLVVVFVTDEVDCSYNPEFEDAVFGETGNHEFWPQPDDLPAPTSAICWNAGVRCEGTGTPEFTSCEAHDKTVFGSDAEADEAVIYPLSRYTSLLDSIRANKAPGAGVFTFGILGVPQFYAAPQDIQYAIGPAPNDPDSFQATYGIGKGCSSGDFDAVPPVRLLEFTQAGDQTGVQLFSICGNDLTNAPNYGYGEFFQQMVTQVGM